MKLTIGERIKECRKNINLTQEQLAEKLCVSFQTVSRWENGNSYPDIEMLPLLAQLFDVTTDYLFGNEGKQREDRANREFDKAIEILDCDNPDKKKAYEVIHNLRLDFPNHNRLAHLFIFVFSNKLWKDPDILYELRLIAENLLGNPKTPKWVKDEVVWYMSSYETDELVRAFIDSHTTENMDLRRTHLFRERYYARNEYEKAEMVKQCILYEMIVEFCTGGWWRKDGKPNDVNVFKWANDIGFQLLKMLCKAEPKPEHPVSFDGSIDIFLGIRILMGFRKSCYHVTLGETEAAYIVLEDAISLLEKAFRELHDGDEIISRSPAFDKLCLKVEFFRDAEGGLTVQPSYSNDENGIYVADYISLSSYLSILQNPKGWEWFNPIRGEERFLAYARRVERLNEGEK